MVMKKKKKKLLIGIIITISFLIAFFLVGYNGKFFSVFPDTRHPLICGNELSMEIPCSYDVDWSRVAGITGTGGQNYTVGIKNYLDYKDSFFWDWDDQEIIIRGVYSDYPTYPSGYSGPFDFEIKGLCDIDKGSCVLYQSNIVLTRGPPEIAVFSISSVKINLQEPQEVVEEEVIEEEVEEPEEVVEEEEIEPLDLIIESSDLTIEELADLISQRELSILEQAMIISELELTSQEKTVLISRLELSITEEQELVDQLQLTLEEKDTIIEGLKKEREKFKVFLGVTIFIIAFLLAILLSILVSRKMGKSK